MNENTVSTDACGGIDVAKKKVDLFVVCREKGKSKVFDSTPAGHRELQRWLGERGFPCDHQYRLQAFRFPCQATTHKI